MAERINIQEVIDSGVLELYVTGALPPEEASEIHQLVQQHEALAGEVRAIEQALMQVAATWAPQPASDQALTKALAMIDQAQSSVPPAEASVAAHDQFPQEGDNVRKVRPFRVWSVAASIFLLASLGINFWFYGQWQGAVAENKALMAENQDAREQIALNTHLIDHLTDTSSQVVELKGLPDYPDASVVIAYKPNRNIIALQQLKLPALENTYSYQLWYISADGPVSAGLITDHEPPTQLRVLEGKANAFAITIEPQGGSATPTLDQMVVLGKVA